MTLRRWSFIALTPADGYCIRLTDKLVLNLNKIDTETSIFYSIDSSSWNFKKIDDNLVLNLNKIEALRHRFFIALTPAHGSFDWLTNAVWQIWYNFDSNPWLFFKRLTIQTRTYWTYIRLTLRHRYFIGLSRSHRRLTSINWFSRECVVA